MKLNFGKTLISVDNEHMLNCISKYYACGLGAVTVD